MTNHGKSDNATKLNLSNGNYILIWGNSMLTGMISVRNKKGECLYQKSGCSVEDLPFAIEIAKRDIQTNVFETE